MKISSKLLLTLCLTAFTSLSFADSMEKLGHRAQEAATALREIVAIPDDTIPESLLEKAVCVATFPNVIKIGFGWGVRFGKGLVSCRLASGVWSNPSYMKIKGGSWGLQIGINSTDLILVFIQPNAPSRLSDSNFTVGGDASVAVGPIGRHLEAGTDFEMDSEIYAYSRSKGLFAGLAIEGALMSVDESSNMKIYGDITAKRILTTQMRSTPRTVQPYVEALKETAPHGDLMMEMY